jgi:hypothetical protein
MTPNSNSSKEALNKPDTQDELLEKILLGLDVAFQRLLEYKKQKNSPLVVIRDNKIVKIKAEDF